MKILSSFLLVVVISLIFLLATSSITITINATPTRPSTEAINSWDRYQLVTSDTTNLRNISAMNVVSVSGSSSTASMLVEGRYNPSIMSTGWNFLQVDTTTGLIAENAKKSSGPFYDARDEFYAAGVLECWLSYQAIKDKDTPGFWNASTTFPGVATWTQDQINWMKSQASAKASAELYWNRVGAALEQLQGCVDGFNRGASLINDNTRISFLDVFAMSFQESFGDVQAHANQTMSYQKTGSYPTKYEDWSQAKIRHCSAAVVATPTDAYISHIAWNVAESMYKIWKIYKFIDVTVSMSSYPAVFYSLDDFYETSNGLAIFETSLVVWNLTMYNDFPSSTVAQFIRVMVANYIASDCVSWNTNFIANNDGTYNNEYFCLDMKKIHGAPKTPSTDASSTDMSWVQTLPSNTVTFIDQLPGFYRAVDATDLLKKNHFISSYNIPNNYEAYIISGNQWQPQPFWAFNYTTSLYARPKIFRELAPKVRTMADMQRMMRWNKFKTDPNSLIMNCSGTPHGVCDPKYSAMLAISCRGELNAPGGPLQYGPNYPYLTQRDHDGIDAKIGAYSFYRDTLNTTATIPARNFPHKALIIGGPTNDDQPTYVFTQVDLPNWKYRNAPPKGMPNVWNFPWIQVQDAAGSSNSGSGDGNDATSKGLGYSFGVLGIFVLIGLVAFVIKNRNPSSGSNGGKPSAEYTQVQ